MTSLSELQERAGIKFKDESLLLRALTHRSYINEHPEGALDNERLEFLGDAVLAFEIASMVYHRFPEMQEGDLTRLRASLVQTKQLAKFAQMFDIGNAVRLGKGEMKSGGQTREALLCDAFEAVIGALYVDQGINEVRQFIEKWFLPLANELTNKQVVLDAKSYLQEWAQENFGETPYYITVDEAGRDHEKVFTVEVRIGKETHGVGKGLNKQTAEQEAAKEALSKAGVI
jgi:ribonuclease-3